MNRGRGRTTNGYSGRGGRSWRSGGYFDHGRSPVGAERHSGEDSCYYQDDGMSQSRGRHLQKMSPASGSSYSKHDSTAAFGYKPKKPFPDGTGLKWQNDPPQASDTSGAVLKDDFPSLSCQLDSKGSQPYAGRTQVEPLPVEETENCASVLHHDFSRRVNFSCLQDESEPSESSQKMSPQNSAGFGDSVHTECQVVVDPFDICLSKAGTPVMLKPSLLVKNREKRNEIKRSMEGQNGIVLRSGMVLLKKYLSLSDQVKIVKACRELGFGSGGFYQPGYRDGAKLHLKMMCLGKNWDPETGNYEDLRPIDCAVPPHIPREFYLLVEKAIKDSHALLQQKAIASHVEDILPWMSPNICIVNFYSASGRLGLHQDRDESPESLHKRLPVVSFSIGDSAEFLYGDQRDVDKAEKVELESGDVLIFGGNSRHIFHGVTAIKQNTAPRALVDETNLRPGRLNLTFREY
ncbi:2-oxoglutarate-dependent dioxygenase family protein, putative isoform 1 [Theobroma cacao]|uniref:DNA N(6)-methyladenine demethylase n=1 Tax=Theobroma cacao TaxID=3641 RepID=A0A061GD55_THECC|nr:2-oxoglutarate-dependent dioxygenase family protein, putative isoform 1 [Theobroma cacao]